MIKRLIKLLWFKKPNVIGENNTSSTYKCDCDCDCDCDFELTREFILQPSASEFIEGIMRKEINLFLEDLKQKIEVDSEILQEGTKYTLRIKC